MRRSIIIKRQIVMLVSLVTLAAILLTLLSVGLVRAARERRLLEAEQSKQAATAPPISNEGTADDGKTRGYLRLPEGVGTLFLFGDDAIYGRGQGVTLTYDCATSYTSLALRGLREEYGQSLRAYAIRDVVKTHTLTYAAEVVARLVESGTPPSVILLAPSDATLAAGLATDPEGYDFGKDLEKCIRALRSYAPRADILLITPTNAAASTARTIREVGEHYGLLRVDLRVALGADPELVHPSGADAGYPTERGSEVAAEAIVEAVGLAVSEEFSLGDLPEDRLYPIE